MTRPLSYRNTADVYDLTDDSVQVGTNPYTYSDFTGFGLRNFTRPSGMYRVLIEACAVDEDTQWYRVEWNATEPPGTARDRVV